nr:reverse transcriptase domain-containing protein [Tanacetum cinerariifolium]
MKEALDLPLDTGKPTNELAKIQIPLTPVLEVHRRFKLSLYVYFVGRELPPVVENYVKNAWDKYEEELSELATRLGKPIMLDSYTSSMSMQSWGRLNYARVFIDIRIDRELKECMVIAIQILEGNEDILHTVRVEYE